MCLLYLPLTSKICNRNKATKKDIHTGRFSIIIWRAPQSAVARISLGSAMYCWCGWGLVCVYFPSPWWERAGVFFNAQDLRFVFLLKHVCDAVGAVTTTFVFGASRREGKIFPESLSVIRWYSRSRGSFRTFHHWYRVLFVTWDALPQLKDVNYSDHFLDPCLGKCCA